MDRSTKNRYQARTGFFIGHWGPPVEIVPSPIQGVPDFAVLVFGPRGARASWRYATNGISEHEQWAPMVERPFRTELFISAAHECAWIPRLLTRLADYVIQHEQSVFEFDAIPLCYEECYPAGSRAVLICPPFPTEAQTIGAAVTPGLSYLIHQVTMLGAQEFARCESGQSREVWEAIARASTEGLVDARTRS